MTDDYKLAIIIPYYKINFFKETIESLVNQTNKKFNLYIGNDKSPNSPIEILNQYSNTLNNITYKEFSENIGGRKLVNQWTRCIALSKTEPWIMVLGDDDVLEANVVEQFYRSLEEIEKNALHVVKFKTALIDEKSHLLQTATDYKKRKASSIEFMLNKLKGLERSSLSEHIFSRSAYEKNGFKDFPVAFGSDDVAWLEFSKFSMIYTINEAIIKIRTSSFSLSSSSDTEIAQKRPKGIYEYLKYLLKIHAQYFTKTQRIEIASKAYNRLRKYDRYNRSETINFIMLMITKIGLKSTVRVLKTNKNYQY